VARFLIVGGGETAAALADALEHDGHVARLVERPERGSLEHVAIVCWLREESPERFLLGAIDSSMRALLYRAGGWDGAVSETARRSSIPAAPIAADAGDPRAWIAETRDAVAALLEPPDRPR
jgi:hypothetical protein